MAADTREDATSNPSQSSKSMTSPSKGSAHEPYAIPVAPPNSNALPAGAGLNTAGARTKQAGYFDALRHIQPSDFKEVHEKPCVRNALLTGIGGGFGIGGVRAILGGTFTSLLLARDDADRYSLCVENLQLGGWLLRNRVLPDVRILPEEKTVRDAGNEEGCGGDRSETGRETKKSRGGQSSMEEGQGRELRNNLAEMFGNGQRNACVVWLRYLCKKLYTTVSRFDLEDRPSFFSNCHESRCTFSIQAPIGQCGRRSTTSNSNPFAS